MQAHQAEAEQLLPIIVTPSQLGPNRNIDPDLISAMGLIFEKLYRLQIITRHDYFNEMEAAEFCRCTVKSIRYHALRSRKLPYLDFSKSGLVFRRQDLVKFMNDCRIASFRG